MPHGAEAAASAIGDAPDGRTFANLAIFSDIGKKMWGEPLGQSRLFHLRIRCHVNKSDIL